MKKILVSLILSSLNYQAWASSSIAPFETWQIKEPLRWQDAMSKLSVNAAIGEVQLPWCPSNERDPILEQAVAENWSQDDCQRAMMLAQPYAIASYSLTAKVHPYVSSVPTLQYDACMMFGQTTAPVCKILYLKQDAEGTYRCAAKQVYHRAEKASEAALPIFEDYQLLEQQSPYELLQATENLPLIFTCEDELPKELHAAAILCIKQHRKVFHWYAGMEAPLNYVKVKRLILPQQEDGTQHYLLNCDVGSGLYCPLSAILHFDQQGQCRLGEYFRYSTSQANDYPRYLQDGNHIKIYNEAGELLEILDTTRSSTKQGNTYTSYQEDGKLFKIHNETGKLLEI